MLKGDLAPKNPGEVQPSGDTKTSVDVEELSAIAADTIATIEQQGEILRGIQDACNTLVNSVDGFTGAVSTKAMELQLALQDVLPRLKSLAAPGSYLYEEVVSATSMLQGMIGDMQPTVDGQPTAVDDLNASKQRFITDSAGGDVVEAMFDTEDPNEFNGLSDRLTASSTNLKGFASHTAAYYRNSFSSLQIRMNEVAGTAQQEGSAEIAQLAFRAAYEVLPRVSAEVSKLASALETNVIQLTTTLETRIDQARKAKF